MTYQQAGWMAIAKRILGWIVFIPALLSTLISLLGFLYQHSEKQQGINAVMLDFVHVMIDMVRFNTPFLDLFWQHSPLPVWGEGITAANVLFFVIYWFIFVGMALCTSGARMTRQVRHIREGLEDYLILEQAKGETGQTRAQLEQRIVIPHHTILLQIFPLYLLPLILLALGYLVLRLLGMI
ncbi:YniB family protein [Edwardsiella tarda]|uniref:YniB family protein n=1 Tax=Edwardsiella tarda TaxID=636 RepID=UPI00351C3917